MFVRTSTRRNASTEQVLSPLVANRALAPASKLAAADWVTRDVHIPGLPAVSDDACYRAMDFLAETTPELETEVFRQVSTALDAEIDLLFFDTTSTYFETETPGEPLARDESGNVLPCPTTPARPPSEASCAGGSPPSPPSTTFSFNCRCPPRLGSCTSNPSSEIDVSARERPERTPALGAGDPARRSAGWACPTGPPTKPDPNPC
jgi:hypothetical protein